MMLLSRTSTKTQDTITTRFVEIVPLTLYIILNMAYLYTDCNTITVNCKHRWLKYKHTAHGSLLNRKHTHHLHTHAHTHTHTHTHAHTCAHSTSCNSFNLFHTNQSARGYLVQFLTKVGVVRDARNWACT